MCNNGEKMERKEKDTLAYIVENMPLAIKRGEFIEKPYTVPCIGEGFINFYYWDTYFTNLGLLEINPEQAKNNLDVMRFFVKKYGFVPNADHLLDRSQPPLFTRGVYDYYQSTGDVEEVKECYPFMLIEYNFWQTKRATPIGLNRYYSELEGDDCRNFYRGVLEGRLQRPVQEGVDEVSEGKHLLAIAESGWDFNPRYKTDYSEFACADFAAVDLNSILYDVEKKIAYFSQLLGEEKNRVIFEEAAATRKAAMQKYMRGENGIYLDYNYVTEARSEVLSVASVLPYALGIADDRESLSLIMDRLQAKYGVLTCEKRANHTGEYQWDYPNMWPPMVYFVLNALVNVGMTEKAAEIASSYRTMVDECLEKTGHLWEKYNAIDGTPAVNNEYDTPPMMGWTAGLYIYSKNFLKNPANTAE